MAIKKNKSAHKHRSNGSRSSNGASSKSPLLVKDARNGTPASSPKNNGTHLRTYSIPDIRLEHPDLSVRQP